LRTPDRDKERPALLGLAMLPTSEASSGSELLRRLGPELESGEASAPRPVVPPRLVLEPRLVPAPLRFVAAPLLRDMAAATTPLNPLRRWLLPVPAGARRFFLRDDCALGGGCSVAAAANSASSSSSSS